MKNYLLILLLSLSVPTYANTAIKINMLYGGLLTYAKIRIFTNKEEYQEIRNTQIKQNDVISLQFNSNITYPLKVYIWFNSYGSQGTEVVFTSSDSLDNCAIGLDVNNKTASLICFS